MTWNDKDHPRRNDGTPGRTQFAGKTNTASPVSLAAPGTVDWHTHTGAVNETAERMGLHSGATYDYRSTSLLVNPDGHAEAAVNLTAAGGARVQLRHDYATGVTSLENLATKDETKHPERVNAVVRDIYASNRSPRELFANLRAETMSDAAVHPKVREALGTDHHVYPNRELHQKALDDAAFETGIRSGHAYEFESVSMLTNPHGEAEAFINLNDGEGTQLAHNYATGTTTYTSRARGILGTTDPELISVAVEDINPDGGDGATGMFNRLREHSLASQGLDHRIRTALGTEQTGRPVDISSLTETPRTVTPEEHGIKGLGNMEISRAGNSVRMAMSLHERVIVPDLSTWDNGSSQVDAHPEMMTVIGEHLGIQPGDSDAFDFRNGKPVYTHYESLGSSTEIDPGDLQSWSGDFTALADPAVVSRLAREISELYEAPLR